MRGKLGIGLLGLLCWIVAVLWQRHYERYVLGWPPRTEILDGGTYTPADILQWLGMSLVAVAMIAGFHAWLTREDDGPRPSYFLDRRKRKGT